MTQTPDQSKKRVTIEAADELRQRILTGTYRAGSTLPGERELSEQLGVSRLTLRSAIAHLEAEGLLRPVHGSGTRVLDYRENGGVDLLGYLAQLAMEGRLVPTEILADLLELRRAVAIEAVGLACERANAAEIADMRAHVARQAELLDQPRAFMQSDVAFARLVVRATHNLAFELIFNTVARTIESNAGLELAYFANARQSIAVYGRLLDVVERRDAKRARQLAERLLTRLDRTTLARIAVLFEGAAEPLAEATDEEEEE